MKKYLGIIFLAFYMISCENSLKPESYIRWMEDPKNGLCKSREMGPVIYNVQYKTPEYIKLKNNNTDLVDDQGHKGIHYFGLSVEPIDHQSQLLHVNLANEQDYFSRLQYYNFYFKNDIYLQVNGKQFRCEYYFFESTGKITPGLKFTLGFDIKEEKGDIRLIVNDQVFGVGGINFLFKEKTLAGVPGLKNKS